MTKMQTKSNVNQLTGFRVSELYAVLTLLRNQHIFVSNSRKE